MPTDNKQTQPGNQVITPVTDDMPPVVMEDTTPPMLNSNDLPLATAPVATTPVVTETNEENNKETNSGSAAPSNDVVTPSNDVVMPPIVTTQKKKFAGGRVIATILGLFLLVGGLGAGIVLVRQNQNIAEKAAILECFPAGTKITTEGGTKSIEDFAVGDKVVSENIESGKEELSSTTKLWKLWSLNMCSVEFEDHDILKLTNPHPLYTKEGWKAINVEEALKHNPKLSITQLTTNDFVKKEDGSWSKITDISCKYGLFRVYNLAVDTNNNYFAQNYLVHNKGGLIYVDTNRDNRPDPDPVPRDDWETGGYGNDTPLYDPGVVYDNSGNPTGETPQLPPYSTDPNNCGGPGVTCLYGRSCDQGQCTVTNQASGSIAGDCGTVTYITNKIPGRDDGGTGISGTFHCSGDASANAAGCNTGQIDNNFNPTSCFCGTVQQDYHDGTFTSFYSSNTNCGGGGGGGGTPPEGTPPSGSNTAVCQNLAAYPTTGNSEVPLTEAQLSALESGDQINVCAQGATDTGYFDIARFTINGVDQADINLPDRTGQTNANRACTLYTIPDVLPADRTFSFSVQLHHASLGWK